MPEGKWDFLTQKVGPAPAYVWVVGGGVGLGLLLRYRGKKRAATASQAPTAAVSETGSIDPTTGMSYADEYGSYPSYRQGAYSGVGGGSISGPLGYFQNPNNAPITTVKEPPSTNGLSDLPVPGYSMTPWTDPAGSAAPPATPPPAPAPPPPVVSAPPPTPQNQWQVVTNPNNGQAYTIPACVGNNYSFDAPTGGVHFLPC